MTSLSRRTSTDLLPSNQSQSGTSMASPIPVTPASDAPGPQRLPKPVTAADIHQELEREQEALVNRLSRELNLLRSANNAPAASVASAASSASASEAAGHSRRHQRTISNTSLGASLEARRHPGLSRQNSSASHRSRTASPAPHRLSVSEATLNFIQAQRVPPPPAEQLSPSMIAGSSRIEETAFYRAELEQAKRENDVLKRRVRELERLIRDKTDHSVSVSGRPRSASASTPTSLPSAMSKLSMHSGMDVGSQAIGVGIPEDEVQVGESAASSVTGRP